jgi:two-component system chemotaxis response regulator CheB
MPAVLTSLTREADVEEGVTGMSDADESEDEIAELPRRDIEAQVLGQLVDRTTVYTCPDCGGALWQADQNGVIQFTCHVGHRYGAEVLLGQIAEELEAALWRCIRILTEKATLTRQLAERMHSSGQAVRAARIEEQADLDYRHQEVIRALVSEGTLSQVAQVLMAERGLEDTLGDGPVHEPA